MDRKISNASADTDQVLDKILKGIATEEELLWLSQWIKDDKHLQYFRQYKEIWHTTTRVSWEKDEIAVAFEKYNRYIHHRQQRKLPRLVLKLMKYAAIAVLGISAGYYSYISSREETVPVMTVVASQAVTTPLLIRSDGTTVDLAQEDMVLTEKDGTLLKRKGEHTISYRNESSRTTEVIYNTLQVPRGKRFNLELSDGTRVWLNSGSILIYPVNFTSKTRTVQLAGHAYFEVEKDLLHPFIVRSGELETRVLGTSFDINAYPGSGETTLTLVEGRVEANSYGNKTILYPDQQIALDTLTRRMWLKEVDAAAITSWKDGILQLEHLTFPQMLDKLSLWYGITFINHSQISDTEHFNGKFDREDIRQAMETIALSAQIQYEILQDTIIIQSKY